MLDIGGRERERCRKGVINSQKMHSTNSSWRFSRRLMRICLLFKPRNFIVLNLLVSKRSLSTGVGENWKTKG